MVWVSLRGGRWSKSQLVLIEVSMKHITEWYFQWCHSILEIGDKSGWAGDKRCVRTGEKMDVTEQEVVA